LRLTIDNRQSCATTVPKVSYMDMDISEQPNHWRLYSALA